jgi:hypothetical protein
VLTVLAHNSEFALVRPLATLLLLALRRGIPAGYWSSGFPRRQLVDLLSSTELQSTVCGRYVLVRAVTALDVTATPPAALTGSTTTASDEHSTSADAAAALSTLGRRLLQEGEHGAAVELTTHQFKQHLLAGSTASGTSSSSTAAAISSNDAKPAVSPVQFHSSIMSTLNEVSAAPKPLLLTTQLIDALYCKAPILHSQAIKFVDWS